MFTKKQQEKLRVTKDDDLLVTFPWYTRSELRRIKEQLPVPEIKLPKILIFDIETAPIKAFTWWIFDQNIWLNQIIDDWFMLTWSAKWLWEKEVIHERLTGKEALKKDDKRITKGLWRLINEADIIIAHNWDRFDVKKMNTRFLKYWLPHPKPYKTIDTLKVLRKNFALTSNKLDYACEFLWLPKKIDTGGFDLWTKCYNWDDVALELMDTYCQNDVLILETVYLRVRPYIKNHPNIWIYTNDKLMCHNCGSKDIVEIWYEYSNKYKYSVCRCNECWALNKMDRVIEE